MSHESLEPSYADVIAQVLADRESAYAAHVLQGSDPLAAAVWGLLDPNCPDEVGTARFQAFIDHYQGQPAASELLLVGAEGRVHSCSSA
jgi:hypothetical protein